MPGTAAQQAAPATPVAEPHPSPANCDAAAEAERVSLEAERTAINRTISDIALGGAKSRRARIGGGDVARHAAGTAASVFLPFGLGIAVNAAAALASKAEGKRKKADAAPPETDVPALIARVNAIEARLAEMKTACP